MKTLGNLISQLIELSDLEDSFFKSRAYKNAALTLRNMSEEEFNSRNDYTDLEGVGYSINEKILEFKSTGIIIKLQNLRSESRDYLDPKEYKIRKGFITHKITFDEATKLLDMVSKVAKFKINKLIPLGSYRRKASRIGDLDIMVHEDIYDQVIERLSKEFKVISSGNYKSQFLIDSVNNVPLDVIHYNERDMVFQMLYLTGSKEFNIRMRSKAGQLGYRLNQEGIFDLDGNRYLVGVKDEKEVFKFLEMDYIEPENR